MIAIGSDHCGYELKKKIEAYLDQRKIPYKDFGCDSDQYCQYPVYGHRVARAGANGECDRGLLFCGTGVDFGRVVAQWQKNEAGEYNLVTVYPEGAATYSWIDPSDK